METNKKVILLSCVDPRLVKPRTEWIEKHNLLGITYTPTRAGGVLSLVGKDENDRKSLLKELDFLVTEGHATEFILMNHTRCKAYAKLLDTKGNGKSEKDAHVLDLIHAEKMLRRHYPNIPITILLGEIDDADRVVIIENPEL